MIYSLINRVKAFAQEYNCKWINPFNEHPSAFWDFLPTACDLAGIEPAHKDINGISFVPELIGDQEKQQIHEYLYWEFNENQGPIQALRRGDWKLVYKHEGKPELYNLSAHIGESKNLAQKKEKRNEMLEILKTVRTEHSEFPLETRELVIEKRKKK